MRIVQIDIASRVAADLNERRLALAWPDGLVASRRDQPVRDPLGVIDALRDTTRTARRGQDFV